MRVIFLTHNYPRYPGDLPGGFLHPLARAVRAAGVEVRVVAPADAGHGGREVVEEVPVRRVRYAPAAWEFLAYSGQMDRALRDPRGALALAGMIAALRRGARAEAADAPGPVVLHAHWWFPAGLAAPPEFPLVVTLHGTDGRLLAENRLARWLGRRVLRRARVVTTVSEALASRVGDVTGLSLDPTLIRGLPVVPTGAPASSGGGGVVVVARLTRQKRLHLLIDAIAILRARGRPLRLTIVGGGEEFAPLSTLVDARALSPLVRMTGPLGPAGVAEALRTADLFALPAEAEGYGLAAAEALIAGVPVLVCHDGGGLVEIAGGAGTAVTAPSAEAIADGITGLLDDPGARPAARAAGAALGARLDPAAVAAQAISWYRRALDGPA